MFSSNSRKDGTLARGPERGDLSGYIWYRLFFVWSLGNAHGVLDPLPPFKPSSRAMSVIHCGGTGPLVNISQAS